MMRFLREDAERAGGSAFRLMRRLRGVGALRLRRRGLRLRSKFGQRRLADERTAFDAAVVLRRGKRVLAAASAERDAAVEASCAGRADLERVEPDSGSNPSRVRTAVANGQGHHTVRHAGEDPYGKLERAARIIEPDQILAGEAERLRRFRTHERWI